MRRGSHLAVLVMAVLALGISGRAMATVVTFDNFTVDPTNGYSLLNESGYAGMGWSGGESDGGPGLGLGIVDTTTGPMAGYATPYSGGQVATSIHGGDEVSFKLPGLVTLYGAWFSAPTEAFGTPATGVQFYDDSGRTSSILQLTSLPQYLGVNWKQSGKVYIMPLGTGDMIFSMDNLTYGIDDDGGGDDGGGDKRVPEPGAGLLMLMGIAPMGLAWIKRVKRV